MSHRQSLAPRTATVAALDRSYLRTLWFVAAGGATLLYLCALPLRWQMLAHPNALTLSHLQTLGISVSVYALWTLTWESILVAAWVLTAFMIWWRCGSERMALFTALVLVLFGVGSGSISPTLRTLLGIHPALDRLQQTVEFLAWYGFALFFYLFPNGRFVPTWTRALALFLLPFFLCWNYAPDSALAPLNWPLWLSVLFIGGMWLSMVFSQGYRFIRVSNPAERQQTRLVVAAAVTIVLLAIVTTAIGALIPGYNPTQEAQATPQAFAFMLVQWPLVLVVALLPAAIAAAIARNRLWEIDRLISRALVYAVLTLFVVVAYVLVVGGLSRVLPDSGNILVSLVITGLIAVAFHPLQIRLQGWVNRMLYGARDDPYSVMANLSRRLETAPDTPGTLQATVDIIARTLRLPGVALHVREDKQMVCVAATGHPTDEPLVLAFTHEDAPSGALHITPRPPDDPLSPAESHLLESMAAQVGIALHNMRLSRALQRSRRQIVTAREEERRRLRRDLHDGLGPRLAGQTLKLEAVIDTLGREPEAARTLLAEMVDESQALIGDVRRLVYGLRPPALDQLGLLQALREQAAQVQRSGLHVTVDAPAAAPPLPAAVEVAAYRIAMEALTNVVRHAQAQHCRIAVRFGEALELVVEDDGRGIPSDYHVGVGILSMCERAEEIGGHCQVKRCEQGGARMTAVLPLAGG